MIYGSMRELLEEDLRKVDRDLQKNGEVLEIALIGGAAIVLGFRSNAKITNDIDVLEERPVRVLEQNGIHAYPQHYLQLLNDYKDRILDVSIDGITNLTVRSLAPEDVALSKMAAGRSKDIDDCRIMVNEGILVEERFRPYYERWVSYYFADRKIFDDLYAKIFG